MPVEALPIPHEGFTSFGLLESIIPVGATTFTLTFGPYTDALGANVADFTGKLFPVDQVSGKRVKVVHLSSGQVILPASIPITVTAGSASVGPLPDTGQASMTPFFYRVEWDVPSGPRSFSPGNKTFAAPTVSGSSIDFDLLDTSTTPDVLVAPNVVSVNGQAGTVTLTASDVGAQPAGSYATTADVSTASTADRARANHTGTQAASTITGLATVATSGAYTDLGGKPTIPTVGAAGAGAAVALSSTDASVTNSRTPTTHATTHASGGSDPVTPAAIGAPTTTDLSTGLAGKVDSGTYTTGLAAKQDTATLSADVATRVSDGSTLDVTLKGAYGLDVLAGGESTMPRSSISNIGVGVVTGAMKLSYLTAKKSETVDRIAVYSGSTAAGATPTLFRVGVYSINTTTGAATLIASTVNDTTLMVATNTRYEKALSVPFSKVTGQRYAIGVLVVTAAAVPTMPGGASAGVLGTLFAQAPRVTGQLNSQTDLPASYTDAALATSGAVFYAELVKA